MIYNEYLDSLNTDDNEFIKQKRNQLITEIAKGNHERVIRIRLHTSDTSDPCSMGISKQ